MTDPDLEIALRNFAAIRRTCGENVGRLASEGVEALERYEARRQGLVGGAGEQSAKPEAKEA